MRGAQVAHGRAKIKGMTTYQQSAGLYIQAVNQLALPTSCGSISGHLVTIPYQIIKHIPTSALLEA